MRMMRIHTSISSFLGTILWKCAVNSTLYRTRNYTTSMNGNRFVSTSDSYLSSGGDHTSICSRKLDSNQPTYRGKHNCCMPLTIQTHRISQNAILTCLQPHRLTEKTYCIWNTFGMQQICCGNVMRGMSSQYRLAYRTLSAFIGSYRILSVPMAPCKTLFAPYWPL